MQEDLSKLSGEDIVKQMPKYILPVIRLHGKKGKFYKYVRGEEGKSEEIELTDKIQGTILKVRRILIGFGKDYQLFTNEHNHWKDKVSLFERNFEKKREKPMMVDVGTRQELKQKYPELKMIQVLYFLLEPQKEVVKLLIKGKGLARLVDFWREFKSHEHIYDYLIEVGIKQEESPLGEYYATTFNRIEEVESKELVAEKIKEVAGKIAEIEEYYEEKPPTEEEIEEEDIPIVEDEKKNVPVAKKQNVKVRKIVWKKEEEEINPEDIPF